MLKNKYTSTLLSITFIFILSFFACNKVDDLNNIDIANGEAEFAIPLFNANVSFNDLLNSFDEDTFITVDPDGLIRLNYKGSLLSASSSDLFEFLAIAGFQMQDTVQAFTLDLPGSLEIDYIKLKGGLIGVSFDSNHTQDVAVKLTIPNLVKNGQPFVKTWNVDYTNNTPVSTQGLWSLADYILTPDMNDLNFVYEAIKADGTRDTLSNVNIGFLNVEYAYVEGFLGNDIYKVGQDTIEIDFFENWTRGEVFFEDPRLKITVFNSFGFPIDAKIYGVDVFTVNGEILPLESAFIEDGIEIDYARFDEVGATKTTEFDFDKDNSNIEDILGAGPVALRYDMDGEPNPDLNPSVRGFMTDTSELRVQVEVELPIHGRANDFIATDIFDIDFSEYENINHAEFKLITENETALDVTTQVYFTDNQGIVLDSLLTPAESVIAAAAVDNDGNVIETEEKTIFIPYTAERFEKIINAEKALVSANFSTYNNGSTSVRVLSDQEVRVRMGVKFGLK